MNKQGIKVGSRVKVLTQERSNNPAGSVGIVSEIRDTGCRVIVKGYTDDNLVNNHPYHHLELVGKTKEEKIAELLKKISKLNKA